MEYVQGEILSPEGFTKGYIGLKQSEIVEIGSGVAPKKPRAKGLIVPRFVNAHTHIGDAFIHHKGIPLPHDVVTLVAPPNGLKHKMLERASENEIITGMKQSLEEMNESGTFSFCDFREGGIAGINHLKTALKGSLIKPVILSRPKTMCYEKNELDLLLKISDGLGLSSISDWEISEIKKIAHYTKQKKKLFAVHASEVFREDIDQILDLKPDFLIHMIAATQSDLDRVKQEDIPIILCPRSNAYFHLEANLHLMKAVGISLMLGTDNAMLHPPNVLDEVNFLRKTTSEFSLQELLMMITFTPRKALNLDDCIHGLNSSSDFIVLDRESLNLLYVFQKQVGDKI